MFNVELAVIPSWEFHDVSATSVLEALCLRLLSDLKLLHEVTSVHGSVFGLKLRQTCAWPLVLKMPDFDFS